MASKLSVFPVTTEINKSRHLSIGGCDLVKLAADFGTPLYIFDEATLRQRCREYRHQFLNRYGGTTVQYASKAFFIGALAGLIKEEGLGLDVVSPGELAMAASARFPMDMVYYHGNNKSAEELKLAISRRVGRIVVDSLDELRLLSRLAEESGRIPDILLRLTPGVDAHTHAHLSTGVLGSKFGFPLFTAADAISQALAAPSLNLVGLHFHIGSLIDDVQPYLEAMDVVLELAAEIKNSHGFEIEELDIGGGFGVQYMLDRPVPDTAYFAGGIVAGLMNICGRLNLQPPALTIEPGRSIVARAGVALYTAGFTKDVAGGRYIAVDGGMADNIRPALYNARYEVMSANRPSEDETQVVTVAGRYCESGDVLVRDAHLPPLAAGDLLAVPVCGAYCIPMSSNYNAALKPPIVMVADGQARLIRRRQTIQDLTCCDLL